MTRAALPRRIAFGWPSGTLPALPVLVLGAALGPHGAAILSPDVLAFLDPAMPVALVALGVLIGIGIGGHYRVDGRVIRAATSGSAVTIALVAAGMFLIASTWGAFEGLSSWFPALVLGICAASSQVERIADPADVLPILLGGVALAVVRDASPAAALLLVVQACAVGLVVVTAGWLLLSRSISETEQRVFAIALLLLLGGAADALSVSALLTGLTAGVFLEWVGGLTRDSIRRDVLRIQHPLLVLVLLVTGARIELPPEWLGLAAAYVFLRTAGTLAGAGIARRIAANDVPPDAGLARLAPGVVGIAFVLDVLRVVGPDASAVLAVAAIGAIGSDVIATMSRPRSDVE